MKLFKIDYTSTNNLRHGLGMNMFNYQELSVSFNEELTERLIEAIDKFIGLYTEDNRGNQEHYLQMA